MENEVKAADQLNLSASPGPGETCNLTEQGNMDNLEPEDHSPGLCIAEEEDDPAMLQDSGVVGNDAMLGNFSSNLEENKMFVNPPEIDIRFEQMMDNLMEEDYLGRLMENSKPEFMMEIDINSLGPPDTALGSQDVVPSAASNPEPDLDVKTSDLDVVSSSSVKEIEPEVEDVTKALVPRVAETKEDEAVNQVTVEGARCQRQKRRNPAVEQAIMEMVPRTKTPRKGQGVEKEPGNRGRSGRAGKPKSARGKTQQQGEALVVPEEVANAFEPKLLQVRAPRKWSARRPIPEEEKDDTYKIKRQINTEATRRCREKRRKIDQQRVELIQLQLNRIQKLEQEVAQYKSEHEVLRSVIQGGMIVGQQEIQQPLLALPAPPPQQPNGKKRRDRKKK